MSLAILPLTDTQRVAAMVAAMAELFGVTASPVRIRGYVEALADLPAATVAEAIRRVTQTWRYPDMPRPGDLRAVADAGRADVGRWRDRCPHTPACPTPTRCQLKTHRGDA
jgi:hypothetical protein